MERSNSNALHSLFNNFLNITVPKVPIVPENKKYQEKTEASTPQLPHYPSNLLIQKPFVSASYPAYYIISIHV